MTDSLKDALGNLHPAFVHFPLGAAFFALFAFVWGWGLKKPWLEMTASWLWVMTFLTSSAAIFTGYLFVLHLGMVQGFSWIPAGSILKGLLKAHVIWVITGTLLAGLTTVGALRVLRGKTYPRWVQLALGTALCLAFGLAGHKGGEMVYGHPDQAAAPSAPSSSGPVIDVFEKVEDYRSKLVLMSSRRWLSKGHNNRWVNTYVSKEAVEAFKNSDPLPEGAVIVKDSLENAGGKPSTVEGPLWVKVKGPPAAAPSTGGWLFGLRWEHPVAGNPETITMPVTWQAGDPHLSYCINCHNHYKLTDYVGGVPEGYEK